MKTYLCKLITFFVEIYQILLEHIFYQKLHITEYFLQRKRTGNWDLYPIIMLIILEKLKTHRKLIINALVYKINSYYGCMSIRFDSRYLKYSVEKNSNLIENKRKKYNILVFLHQFSFG